MQKKRKGQVDKATNYPGFYCRRCKQVVGTFARHDWNNCLCGNYIDGGGADYTRRGGRFEDMIPIIITFEGEQSFQKVQVTYADQYGFVDMGGVK